MIVMTPTATPSESPVSHVKSLAIVMGLSVVCLGLAVAAGFAFGGQQTALEAGVGMLAAAAGGLVAWAVVALSLGPNSPVTAAPMMGLMVRLAVTGAGVGFALIGLGFEKRPVLISAMFGYVVLMAAETILLYRFASSSRQEGRPTLAESDQQH